jgi:hypothetical protein
VDGNGSPDLSFALTSPGAPCASRPSATQGGPKACMVGTRTSRDLPEKNPQRRRFDFAGPSSTSQLPAVPTTVDFRAICEILRQEGFFPLGFSTCPGHSTLNRPFTPLFES